tara:strand:- start:12 stop:269 length:258 start_codon:yes stop_codon:yes gene_type:complete
MSIILIPVVLVVYTLVYIVCVYFIGLCIKNTNNHEETIVVANPIRYGTVVPTQVSATPVDLDNEEVVNIITVDLDGNISEQLSIV